MAKKASKKTSWRWRLFSSLCVLLVLFLAVNYVVQIYHKPTELIGLFDNSFHKNPESTWLEYESLFRQKSTSIMTPDLLAALAQAESNANPIVRTYWRLNLFTSDWRRWFAPASSAVGMYQITDGTFIEAKEFCVREGQVYRKRTINSDGTCWSNFVFSRLVPAHAIEMTAARLHWHSARIIIERRAGRASLAQRQALASIIHLCGVQKGELYVKSGFNLSRVGRCGDHGAHQYVGKVQRLQAQFRRLASESDRRRLAGR